jgi:hypothetical protein
LARAAGAAPIPVGAFGKHGVEVSGDDELRLAGAPPANRHDVAFTVDGGIREAELVKPFQIILGAQLLLERRRRHLGNADLLAQSARIIRLDVVQRLGDFWVCQDFANDASVDCAAASGRGSTPAQAQGQSSTSTVPPGRIKSHSGRRPPS